MTAKPKLTDPAGGWTDVILAFLVLRFEGRHIADGLRTARCGTLTITMRSQTVTIDDGSECVLEAEASGVILSYKSGVDWESRLIEWARPYFPSLGLTTEGKKETLQ